MSDAPLLPNVTVSVFRLDATEPPAVDGMVDPWEVPSEPPEAPTHEWVPVAVDEPGCLHTPTPRGDIEGGTRQAMEWRLTLGPEVDIRAGDRVDSLDGRSWRVRWAHSRVEQAAPSSLAHVSAGIISVRGVVDTVA